MLTGLFWICLGILVLFGFLVMFFLSDYDKFPLLMFLEGFLLVLLMIIAEVYPNLFINTPSSQVQLEIEKKNLSHVVQDFKNQEHLSVKDIFQNGEWITTMKRPGEYEFVTKNGLFDVFISPGYHISLIERSNGAPSITTQTDDQTKRATGQTRLSSLIKNFEIQKKTSVEGVYRNGNLILSLDNPGEYTIITKNGLFDVYLSSNDKIIFIQKQ